jgi:polysaccharide biosynthesis protein PslH
MRILFISQTFPYPLNTGSHNCIYHWLEACSCVHDVHLFVVTAENIRDQAIPGLDRVAVHVCPIQVSRGLPNRALRQAACLVHRIPVTPYILSSSEVRRQLITLIGRYHFDVTVLGENPVAVFAPLLRSFAPVLLLKHSVHAIDARDVRARKGRLHPRWILEERIVRRFEAETCRAATVVCCVTREDAVQLISRYGLSNPVEPIPVGVDLTQFPHRECEPNTETIGFFGNLTWGANVDAAQWFCREVLPRVWQAHPDAKFLVAGIGSEKLRSFSQDGRVQFLGRVPSIPEAMKEVRVGVAPIRSGTGIRFKLLEMLSMGIPTVSTSLGAEGTSCIHGKDLLIADDADTFSSSISTLLSNESLRRNLAASGTRVASSHSWINIYPKILTLLDVALQQGPQAAEKRIIDLHSNRVLRRTLQREGTSAIFKR